VIGGGQQSDIQDALLFTVLDNAGEIVAVVELKALVIDAGLDWEALEHEACVNGHYLQHPVFY
jgi:hypothetical protein